MKTSCCLLLLGFSQISFALEPLIAHIDIDPRFDVATNQWTWKLIANGVDKNPELSYMPGRDLPSGPTAARTGERHVRPTSSAWDFLGVASGQNVWIFTQLNNHYAWLGFHDTQLSFTQALQIRLHSVEGPAGGVFSLYNTSTSVLLNSIDGISSADVFSKPQSHAHMNWAFSKKGMWRISLTVQGFLGSNQSNPSAISAPVPLYFAIGDRAQWRASQFTGDQVMNDELAGDLADPDSDGICNLLEYAFGGNPLSSSQSSVEHFGPILPKVSITEVGLERFMQIQFYRRISSSNPEASYNVEWNSSLQPETWHTGGVIVSTSSISSKWELVVVRDSQSISQATNRFVRVRVTGL